MDPLSIVAGTAGFASLLVQLTTVVYNLRSAHRLPPELSEVCHETLQLKTLVETVDALLHEIPPEAYEKLLKEVRSTTDGIRERCTELATWIEQTFPGTIDKETCPDLVGTLESKSNQRFMTLKNIKRVIPSRSRMTAVDELTGKIRVTTLPALDRRKSSLNVLIAALNLAINNRRGSKSHRDSGYSSGISAELSQSLLDLPEDLIDLTVPSDISCNAHTSIAESAKRPNLASSGLGSITEIAPTVPLIVISTEKCPEMKSTTEYSSTVETQENPMALANGSTGNRNLGEAVDKELLQELRNKRINYDEDLHYSLAIEEGYEDLIRISLCAEHVTAFTREITSCALLNPREPLERSDKIPPLYPWELKNMIRHFHEMQNELLPRLQGYISTLVDDPEALPKLDLIRHQLEVVDYLLADIASILDPAEKVDHVVEDVGLIIRDSLASLLDLTRQFAKWSRSPNPSKRNGHLRHCAQENNSVSMNQYRLRRASKKMQWKADNVFRDYAITRLPKTICPHTLWCIRTRAVSFVLERLKFNKEALCVRWALHLSATSKTPLLPNGVPHLTITGHPFVHRNTVTNVKGVQVLFDPAMFKTREISVRWFQGAQTAQLTAMEERLHCSLQDRVEEFSGPADRCRSHDWEELYWECTCHVVPGVDDDETVLGAY